MKKAIVFLILWAFAWGCFAQGLHIGIINQQSGGTPTVDYSLANATIYGTELDLTAEDPEQIQWSPLGGGQFLTAISNTLGIWDLAIGDNIDDATFDQNNTSGSNQWRSAFQISPDGAHGVGVNFSNPVDSYETAYSIPGDFTSNGSFNLNGNGNFLAQEIRGGYWRPDTGLEAWFLDPVNKKIYHYTLNTAWNGTLTASGDELTITNSDLPAGLCFSPDGKYLWYCNRNGDNIDQWVMTSPYDITTATYDLTFDINPQTSTPRVIAFFGDGTGGDKLLVFDSTQNEVLQINLNN